MNALKMRLLLANVLVPLIVLGTRTACADPIRTLEVAQALNAAIPDGDFSALTEFVGHVPGESLDYGFSADLAGWSATLSGQYLGVDLNVTYAGDLSAYPSGPVTWTSTGTYGSAAWNGGGSAMVTDTAEGFLIDNIDTMLIVGADVSQTTGYIPVSWQAPFQTTFVNSLGLFTAPGIAQSVTWTKGDGIVMIGGVPKYVTYSDFHYKDPANPDDPGILRIYDYLKENGDWAPLNNAIGMDGWIRTAVPEPGSLAFLMFGVLGMLGRKRNS
jgi:hypothetical protein